MNGKIYGMYLRDRHVPIGNVFTRRARAITRENIRTRVKKKTADTEWSKPKDITSKAEPIILYDDQPQWRWSLWLCIEYNSLFLSFFLYSSQWINCEKFMNCTEQLYRTSHCSSGNFFQWFIFVFPWQFVNFYPRTCPLSSSMAVKIWVGIDCALFIGLRTPKWTGLLTFDDIRKYLNGSGLWYRKTQRPSVNNISWTLYCFERNVFDTTHDQWACRYQCCVASLHWQLHKPSS